MKGPKYSLLSTELPFRPTLIEEPILSSISEQIKRGGNPLASIAFSIRNILQTHTRYNLEPNLETLHQLYATTMNDLEMFQLGYMFVVDTTLATAIAGQTSENRQLLVQSLFSPTEDPFLNSLQARIRKGIKSTINLFNLDESGVYLFKFLEDYPHSRHTYFLIGMEVAFILFSGFTQKIAEQTPKLNLLSTVGFDVTE